MVNPRSWSSILSIGVPDAASNLISTSRRSTSSNAGVPALSASPSIASTVMARGRRCEASSFRCSPTSTQRAMPRAAIMCTGTRMDFPSARCTSSTATGSFDTATYPRSCITCQISMSCLRRSTRFLRGRPQRRLWPHDSCEQLVAVRQACGAAGHSGGGLPDSLVRSHATGVGSWSGSECLTSTSTSTYIQRR